MATPFRMVSRDAQIALTEFSTAFDAALSVEAPQNWSALFGETYTSKAIQTRFPIPVDAAGYVQRKGDDRLRDLFLRSMLVTPYEWADGVAIDARVAEAPEFIGWGGAPARMATEAQRMPDILVAAMLEANPLLDLYREELPGGIVASTINLFHSAHLVNVFDPAAGTFDNDHSAAALNVDMLVACKTRFRKRLAPNGRPLGLALTHLLVPPDLEQTARDLLENDLLLAALENVEGTQNVGAAAINNRHKGTVQLVVSSELTSASYIYPIAANKRVAPWVVQTTGTPEQIVYDKTSDRYKDTGKIGVKAVLTLGVSAALPHAIERIQIVG